MDEPGFKPSGHTFRRHDPCWFHDLKEVGVERRDGMRFCYHNFDNKPKEIPVTEFDVTFSNV